MSAVSDDEGDGRSSGTDWGEVIVVLAFLAFHAWLVWLMLR